MMLYAHPPGKTPAAPGPAWTDAHVAVTVDDGACLLDDGRLARRAASCLVLPEPGDRVLAATGRDGVHFILHVLARANHEEADVGVPGVHRLTIRQPQVAVHAREDIALRALRNVDVCAAGGTLALSARNLFATAHDSLVQAARHVVGTAEHYLLDVKQLLKLHGRQALITADGDVKVDGERISIG